MMLRTIDALIAALYWLRRRVARKPVGHIRMTEAAHFDIRDNRITNTR